MLYWQAALEGKREKNSSFSYSSIANTEGKLVQSIHPWEVRKWNLFKSIYTYIFTFTYTALTGNKNYSAK